MFDEAFAASIRLVSPGLAQQPSSQTVAIGSTASFRFKGPGSETASYQWSLNGTAIAGATHSSLIVKGSTPADAGTYTCVGSGSFGAVRSEQAALTVVDAQDPGRLVDVSCRANVGTGSNVLIAGFAVGGPGAAGPESLLIRGSGPALVPFGVLNVLPDPALELHATGLIAANSGWNGDTRITAASASVGAFPWPDPSSKDSALVASLGVGLYSVVISGANGDSGTALAEVYDATPDEARTPTTPRLVNLSARAQVGQAGAQLIVGFVIGGTTAKTILVRATGPGLATFGVAGVLPDPQVQLRDSTDMLATNNGWAGDPQIAAAASLVGAFAWSDPASHDSALLTTLPPGVYTVEVSGEAGDSGVALVEVYEVP
jgi:hypothetical protein